MWSDDYDDVNPAEMDTMGWIDGSPKTKPCGGMCPRHGVPCVEPIGHVLDVHGNPGTDHRCVGCWLVLLAAS